MGCSATAVAVHFRARFLTALKNQEVLDSDQIEGLMSWNHNSGFNVPVGKPIDRAEGSHRTPGTLPEPGCVVS